VCAGRSEGNGDQSGRPALAVGEEAIVVAWRAVIGGAESSWIRALGPDGSPDRAPEPLGSGRSDWATLAGPVGGLVIAAWSEAGAVHLQARDAATGEALADAVSVDPTAGREARRPAVGLVAAGDAVVGLITWEEVPPGAADDDLRDRAVFARWLEVTP
jgi:hypothetical protein